MTDKLQEYLEQRDKRLARRKSPWNLAILAIMVMFTAIAWIALSSVASELHGRLHSGQTLSNSRGIGTILVALAPFFIAFPFGGMLGNWIVAHLSHRIRSTLDAEAVEGDPHSTYKGSQSDLASFAMFLTPIGLVLLCLGVYLPWLPLPGR